ncbi:hypothetical protein N0V94_006626 [Neodidymelliopsis sp. IMI 364377]|nr:hypothetical protein N0V94_006626 [Neodidymelliopsis sp. IMI 364377]
MDFSNAALPAHYGLNFTKTFHSSIPSDLTPATTHLPKPFIVVVTGAGKGLGYHISLAFASAGCSGLAISSRTRSDLDTLEAEVAKVSAETEVLKVVCDVQNDEDVKNLEKEVRVKWGRVDVVIANAGVISSYIEPTSSSSTSNLPQGLVEDSDWARVIDINLNGVWRVSKAFLPLLIETKDASLSILARLLRRKRKGMPAMRGVVFWLMMKGLQEPSACG